MENIAELMDPGGIAEALSENIPGLRNSSKSFLEEQDEKPSEVLKMVDSDILDLAQQVGDEMDEESQNASSADLSFLTDTVGKEDDGVDDDPALSFLVGGGKMEVTSADLDFLDDESLNEAGSSDESDLYEDESEDDKEDEEDEESGSSSSDKDTKKEAEDQDDGVFGQVSFYDDDSTAMEKAKKIKPKKEKKKAKTVKKKRKAVEEGDEREKPAKKKCRKKKKVEPKEEGDEGEDGDDVIGAGTTQMRRKNIRSILSEKDLDKDMLSAQNEELERQKRLMELKKSLLKENAAGLAAKAAAAASKVTSTAESSSSTDTHMVKKESFSKPVMASAGTSPPREKDSQLKSLLQVAEEEAEKEAEVKAKKQLEISKIRKETRDTSPPSDIITLSSDSESSEEEDEDSDNAVMVSSDEEDELGDPEDVNNAGAHIDDSLNLPDEQGRVKVNVGHPPEDPDIFLAPQIAQAIKPHQIGGVRFLYDNILESLERFRTTPGFGCILAHSMGLGKTIQLISFIDIFIRCAQGKRVLCIVPINTLQNWLAEFNYWLPPPEKLHPDDNLTQSRVFPLYIINDNMKTTAARAAVIAKWKEHGGALLIGYEMFRLLSSKKAAPSKAKSRSKKSEVIDVEEEDKNKSLMIDMHEMLVDPGPDLVMCDEGHRIKNSSAAISQALKTIKTRRRVVLTGYPLQNNLMEYWCMVDFVRPNFLGTKTEFSNMFERPIMNGQCLDSTGSDKKIMRHRSYVLHNLLEGFVQRRGHTVLQVNLPPKMEHVFLVRMSPIQRKIYVEFMNAITESGLCSWANNNPLKAFAVCCKIWNHPDILHEVLTKHIADKDNDLDIDTGEGRANKKKKKPGLAKSESSASIASTDSSATTAAGTSTITDPANPAITPSASTASLASMASETSSDKNPITYDWAEPLMKDYIAGVVENSGKFVLMYGLIEECIAVGDKVLIFSQSLLTLNKIEEFMGRMRVPRMEFNETWQKNRTYFRLDGSTSAQEREKLINQFNDPCGTAWVFLLSTKAGCLGINLVAANRVIVIDASWNPCHDCQAICRVYRFGQVKSSYVYRLITENTLERRIYDRQISKQGMSDRIVDDMNPENKLTRRQVENLLDFEDQEYPDQDFSNAEEKYGKDQVLVRVLQKYGQWLTKHPFTHESLLIDRKELRLSKREKRLAKEGYARDKRMNVNYTRPSYAAYYPQMGGILPNRLPLNSRYNYAAFRRGPIVRPIASVRPMISSSAVKGDGKIKQFGGQPLRPGVTIHQVITTTEIVLPGTNTSTPSGGTSNKISAGQKILVIKTPKGVYIRTNDGKMFAVRSKSATGLGNVVAGGASTGGAASTTTTTTLTSADGNRVFVTPGAAGLAGGLGGKKPPIIIVSNKKGMSGSVVRGGSILQTLPYGNSTVMSALRPSLLKAGAIKTLEGLTGASAGVTKTGSITTPTPSTTAGKVTTLADLIADVNESTSWDPEKKTAEGGTQSEGSSGGVPMNKPVIVLPSLAVRTPRPVTSIQSSTVATTSPGGGTVVIMPTKPVISMGTKRTAKAPRSRKSAKNKTGALELDNSVRKPGVSLLTGEVKPGASVSAATPVTGPSTSISSTTGAATTTTVAVTNTPAMSTSSTGNQSVAVQQTGQMPKVNQTSETSQQQQQQQQHQQLQQQGQAPTFPDLNRMWQNNFGSMPPSAVANNTNQQPTPNNFNNGNSNNNNANSNAGFQMPSAPSQGQNSGPTSTGDAMNNKNMTTGFGGQQTGLPGTTNPQHPYGAMNTAYMPGNMSMGPYASPGQPPAQGQGFSGSMQNQMGGPAPYMSGFHPGYMGQPSAPFGQNVHPPIQNQNSVPPPQQGMYGAQNSAPGNFGSTPTSFGMPGEGNQQGQFGGMASFPNNSNGGQGQQLPFGPNQSNMQAQGPMSSLLADTKGNQNFSQPASSVAPPAQNLSQPPAGFLAPSNPSKQPAPMFSHDSPGNFGSGQVPSSPSTVSHSVGGMLASPARSGGNSRDPSPFSLTLQGSDSGNAEAVNTNTNHCKSKSNKTKGSNSTGAGSKSKASKKKNSSSSTQSSHETSAGGGRQKSSASQSNSKQQQHHQAKASTLNVPSPGPVRHQENVKQGDGSRPSSQTSATAGDHTSVPGLSASPAFGNFHSSASSMVAAGHPSNSIVNFPSFQPNSGFDSGLDSFGISSLMGGSTPLSSEMGMTGSAFRAHQSSSSAALGLPSPAINSASPFGGFGNMPGFGFNSGMSAFTGGFAGGGYGGMPTSFPGYGGGYGAAAFSSGMMPPPPAPSQSMMGYGHPQAHLGYPSMSSLMMGTPATPTASPGAMWPMMTPPATMMGAGYGYHAPHASMGFPAPGLDGQSFGSLGPGPSSN